MDEMRNQAVVRDFMERAFHRGDLTAVDDYTDSSGTDHQETPGSDLNAHLKEVIVAMRAAFPDLNFEIHEMLAEGEIVAFRSTMTGTHLGTLSFIPGRSLPPTERRVSVPHMHFIRLVNGKTTDLWHLWNTPLMLQQLGVLPVPQVPAI